VAFTIKVNGAEQRVDVDGNTPLPWVLPDVLGMTGTKFGCGGGSPRCLHGAPGWKSRAFLRTAQMGASKAFSDVRR
jgi:hypothetical protein